jgi:hypothetical protein
MAIFRLQREMLHVLTIWNAESVVENQHDDQNSRSEPTSCMKACTVCEADYRNGTLSASSMLCNLLYENVMEAELNPAFAAMLRSTRTSATQSTRQLTVILKKKVADEE